MSKNIMINHLHRHFGWQILGLFLLLFLSACSSNSQQATVKYYTLDIVPTSVKTFTDKPLIKLQPIQLPAFLSQQRLVLRKSNQEIVFANYHSWADNFPNAISRVVLTQLNQPDSQFNFALFCKGCGEANIQIHHFYPTEKGNVILAGTFQFKFGDDLLLPQNFLIERTLEKDGFDESVKQMNELLIKLAAMINSYANKLEV